MLDRFTFFIYILFLFIFSPSSIQAQEKALDYGLGIQVYPTGVIPGVELEYNFGARNSIGARLAYQVIRHRDLGKHDDERGSGYGFTTSYRRYFSDQYSGWSISINNDFWWNSIRWKDSRMGIEEQGKTEILVLQPTISISKTFIKSRNLFLMPSLAFGYEVNIRTQGEATGEGAIILIGLKIGKRRYF